MEMSWARPVGNVRKARKPVAAHRLVPWGCLAVAKAQTNRRLRSTNGVAEASGASSHLAASSNSGGDQPSAAKAAVYPIILGAK